MNIDTGILNDPPTPLPPHPHRLPIEHPEPPNSTYMAFVQVSEWPPLTETKSHHTPHRAIGVAAANYVYTLSSANQPRSDDPRVLKISGMNPPRQCRRREKGSDSAPQTHPRAVVIPNGDSHNTRLVLIVSKTTSCTFKIHPQWDGFRCITDNGMYL
jgi:hypothetical protein